MVNDLKANVENAIAFYCTAYERDPAKAVELCVGDDYIQHNPIVADVNSLLLNTLLKWLGIMQINP